MALGPYMYDPSRACPIDGRHIRVALQRRLHTHCTAAGWHEHEGCSCTRPSFHAARFGTGDCCCDAGQHKGFARISGSRGSRRLPSPTSRIAAFTGWVSARIAAFTGDTAVRAHARGRVGALGVASRGLAGFLRFPPREYQHNVTEAGRLP